MALAWISVFLTYEMNVIKLWLEKSKHVIEFEIYGFPMKVGFWNENTDSKSL